MGYKKSQSLFFVFHVLLFIVFSFVRGSEIILHNRDADIWLPNVVVNGTVTPSGVTSGTVYINDRTGSFSIDSITGAFSVECPLEDNLNILWCSIVDNGVTVKSDTLTFRVRYNIKPEMVAYAAVEDDQIELRSAVVDNPDSSQIEYIWSAAPGNPSTVTIHSPTSPTTLVTLGTGYSTGEYYFNLTGTTSQDDTVYAQTFVTVQPGSITPFDIYNDHAAWIDSAVIYEVTPYNFVAGGTFQDIADKITELVELGINTLWIQPVFQTWYGGQGYDVTDYFSVRSDIGGVQELDELIQTARENGLRVMFDIVLNHTSIKHPYARETVEVGTASHYYNFYQRTTDNKPYSMHYHSHPDGFVYYFWEDLPNLNYENPEVQNWMLEACKYWVEKYDLDGYRFDAIWGVNSRASDFTRRLRLTLKRIKPDILLLAEDKATSLMVFDERFDAAFDWNGDEWWVSKWAWQVDYSDYQSSQNKTIFNQYESLRVSRLHDALTNNGDFYPPGAKILRFMENNDQHRFIRNHGLERTIMTAGLIFTLPGIPMIYNGQEIGTTTHPYLDYSIFNRAATIGSMDSQGLFSHYSKLAGIRQNTPSLRTDNFEVLDVVSDGPVYGFHRWSENDHTIILVNMGDRFKTAHVALNGELLEAAGNSGIQFYDLVRGDYISEQVDSTGTLSVQVNRYETLMLNVRNVVSTAYGNVPVTPARFELYQNYPNPFNPETTIRYLLPADQRVNIRIVNVLGQEVAELVEEVQPAGYGKVTWNGQNRKGQKAGGGVYFCIVQVGDASKMIKMILLD